MFDITPDFTFFLAVLSVFFSIFIVIKLYGYYKATGAREYLLIALIFIRYAYTNLVIIRVIYIQNFTVYWGNQDPFYWWGYPWVGMFLIATMISWLAIFLHAIRVRNFRTQKLVYKVVVSYIFIELVTHIVSMSIHYIETMITRNWDFSGSTGYWNPYKLYMQIFPSYYYLPKLSPVANPLYFSLPGILTFIFVIFTYITLKPEKKMASVLAAKISWIIFVTVPLFFEILTYLLNTVFLDFNESQLDDTLFYFRFQNIAEFLTVLSILVLLLFYPQTILVTKEQILRASKLYNIIQDKAEVKSGLPLLNTSDNFKTYISDLPSDLTDTGD